MRPGHLLALFALFVAGSAFAAEQKCPLELNTCLEQYLRMKERPWLGISVERDSTGRAVVVGVESRSPAQRAGVRPGDVLRRIEGRKPADWFAGKAGWKSGDVGDLEVTRHDRPVAMKLRYEAIPEAVFARIIGVHMVEGHLAYMHGHKESATEDH